MTSYAMLLLGIALAAGGGELFVRALTDLARWLRVPAGVIAVTLAAFSTSIPELAVGISAAWIGAPSVAIGDSLGSNVVNLGLVLGCTLLFGRMHAGHERLIYNLSVAALTPLVTAVFIAQGGPGRLQACVLMALFSAWLTGTIVDARRRRQVTPERPIRSLLWTMSTFAGGMVVMLIAGRLIVIGATGVANHWEIDAFLVGALIVALGTSVPELAISVVARMRGREEIGLGTLVGSNIFNGLFIVPLVTLIQPAKLYWLEATPVLGFGFLVVVLTYPTGSQTLSRGRGVLLLATYAAFVATLTFSGGGH